MRCESGVCVMVDLRKLRVNGSPVRGEQGALSPTTRSGAGSGLTARRFPPEQVLRRAPRRLTGISSPIKAALPQR